MISPDPRLMKRNSSLSVLFACCLAAILLVYPFSPFLSVLALLILFCSFYVLGAVAFRRRAAFACIQCGLCCRLRVTPTDKDIRRLERATGVARTAFLERGSLRRPGGYCLFLKKEGSLHVCSVYGHRPDVCRRWPFGKSPVTWKWFFLCPAVRDLLRKKDR